MLLAFQGKKIPFEKVLVDADKRLYNLCKFKYKKNCNMLKNSIKNICGVFYYQKLLYVVNTDFVNELDKTV